VGSVLLIFFIFIFFFMFCPILCLNLQLFVGEEGFCLIYVICVCLRIVVSNTYCVVFLFCLSSSSVLCMVVSNTYCVVFFVLFVFVLCLVYPRLPVSRDYPLSQLPKLYCM